MSKTQNSEVRWAPLILGGGFVLLAAAGLLTVFFADELFPEYSPAHRGALVAQETGCLACHTSTLGRASINPVIGKAPSDFPRVPLFSGERMSIEEIDQWIINGISDEKARSRDHVEALETRALGMPAYGDRLTPAEIDDLTTYVALSQYHHSTLDRSSASRAEQLARDYACFTCHGELGQGGVENPGSLKGYIPGFFGTDFRALTRNGNRQDIREWIEDGSSEFIESQGFAGFYPGQFFSERQAIKMPAYRNFLEDEEVELLVDFLIEFMETGPLDGEGILEFRPVRAE